MDLACGRFAQRFFASRADRAVEPRHHLGRHQLHRALRELRVHPVHAGVDDLAELARALAKRKQLLHDPVHRAAEPDTYSMNSTWICLPMRSAKALPMVL